MDRGWDGYDNKLPTYDKTGLLAEDIARQHGKHRLNNGGLCFNPWEQLPHISMPAFIDTNRSTFLANFMHLYAFPSLIVFIHAMVQGQVHCICHPSINVIRKNLPWIIGDN